MTVQPEGVVEGLFVEVFEVVKKVYEVFPSSDQ